jgi:hypothetical protein
MRTAREQSKLTPQERNQAYQGTSCEMTCGTTVCLGSYATLTTIIVIILASLYHNTGYEPTCSEGTTDCKTQIQNHLDILSVDASSNDIGNEDGTCNCNTWNWLGFEIFELIVLTLIGIAILYFGLRCSTEGKSWYQKWKQSKIVAKQQQETAKFEKWKAQFDSSTSTTGRGTVHGNKVHSETRVFGHGLRKPKLEYVEPELASYEQGEPGGSDEEQA